MVHSSLEDQWKGEGYVPEVMESLLSKNQLIKDEEHQMKQPVEAMKYFGIWLLGIIFVAIALAFMFLIYRQVSMQRPVLSTDYHNEHADQTDIEDDTFGIQEITDTFQKSSNNVEELANLQTEIINQSEEVSEDSAMSRHYNDDLQRSIEDDMTEALQPIKLDDEVFTKFLKPLIISEMPKPTSLDANSFNLPIPSTAVTIPNTITTTTTRKYRKYKFNAYIKTSFGTFTKHPKLLSKSSNFPKTDMPSSSNTTDNMPSVERSVYSAMPIIREFSISSNLVTTDPQFTRGNGENDVKETTMTPAEFTINLENLRITTISTTDLTTVSSQILQDNMVTIDQKIETEIKDDRNKDVEEDYEYEDILYISSTSTSTTTTTTTTITTTTTSTTATTTTTTSITAPEFTSTLQFYHHHHHHFEYYDHRSPIIITALFDIGRGKWPRYTRTYEQYMNYLQHLLKLRNCLVIYTDSRGAEFVRQMRSAHNTQIFEMSMHDLPLYRYREEMEGIIRKEQEDWRFGPKTRYHPEANSADYNIIVNSKPYFLYNATQSARFRASDRMFAWIDAGYGHGREGIIPNHCHWRPELRRDRMTVIKLTPAHDKVSRYSITDLYRVDWVVLSGGFIAGDTHTINRFYRFYQKSFMELLDSGRIDDDQTVLTLMLKHYATLFNPMSSNGDWYAVFRLFPCHNRQ